MFGLLGIGAALGIGVLRGVSRAGARAAGMAVRRRDAVRAFFQTHGWTLLAAGVIGLMLLQVLFGTTIDG